MDPIVKEQLDECIDLANRLRNLQDEDSLRITACLRGEQQEKYRKLMYLEQDKLEQFQSKLHSLQDAQMYL